MLRLVHDLVGLGLPVVFPSIGNRRLVLGHGQFRRAFKMVTAVI